MAIKVPRIANAFNPLEGLSKIGIIEEPGTKPKSSRRLLIFPFAAYHFNFAFLI